jgi:PAS domain-containing protein
MLVLFSGENGPRDTIRFIEEKAAAGIWFCDLKTRKMEWSSGFFRLLGLEPDSAEPSFALF